MDKAVSVAQHDISTVTGHGHDRNAQSARHDVVQPCRADAHQPDAGHRVHDAWACLRPEDRLPWYLLAAAVTSFAAVHRVDNLLTSVLHRDALLLAAADVLRLAMYP